MHAAGRATRPIPSNARETIRTRKCVSPSGRAPAWPAWCALSSSTTSSVGASASESLRLHLDRPSLMASHCTTYHECQAIRFLVFSFSRTHNPDMAQRTTGRDSQGHPHQAGRARCARTTRRPCGTPDCTWRRRLSRSQIPRDLNEYFGSALQHARAHNEHWDYFSGMNDAEIEAFRIDAVTGHRPTWPLGKRAARIHRANSGSRSFGDTHGLFGRRVRAVTARTRLAKLPCAR